MPTSDVRRLSRDAVIRAHIAEARERGGFSIERLARELNAQVHALAPAKAEQHRVPNLAAFERADAEYDAAVIAWARRVGRWADGSHEVPVWLEEPLVQSLPEPYRTRCRHELVIRMGCVPVQLPPGGGLALAGDAEALARASVEHGGALGVYAQMLFDGQVGPEDRHLLPQLHREIMEAIGALWALWLWAQLRAGEDGGA